MIELALAANVIFFAGVVLFLYWRGYINFYSGLFVYLAFHFIAFVQRPIVVYAFDLRAEFIYLTYMPTEGVFLSALLAANLGLVSFVFGYLFMLGFQPLAVRFQSVTVTEADKKALLTTFLLLLPLILYSMYLVLTTRYYHDIGLFDDMRELSIRIDAETGASVFVESSAYIVFARDLALPFASIFAIVNRLRWWSFIPLVFCALMALQVGARWETVISTFVAVTIVLYYRRYSLPRLRHAAILLVILFLFILMGQNRSLINEVLLGEFSNLTFDLGTSSLGDHPDFANFEWLTFVIGKVPDISRSYTYFTQYLGLFTQPIPRVLWPDKPIGSPIMWVNLQSYGRFIGRTTTLVGDGWMSLGYIGVMITLSGAGAGYGWLYKKFCSANISIYMFCGYFWMEGLLIQWARDGGTRILEFAFFCVAPLFLAYVVKQLLWQVKEPRPGLIDPLRDRKMPLRYD